MKPTVTIMPFLFLIVNFLLTANSVIANPDRFITWFIKNGKAVDVVDEKNAWVPGKSGLRATGEQSRLNAIKGTGEAALTELSYGHIYYNSRRHLSIDGLNPRMRHIAWSYDGGQTWEDLSVSEELPDGDQHRDYGLMGGLVRLPLDDHDILLFSNIESPEGRTHGTVWASFDGGKTWPIKRLVEEGDFAYSSMAAGRVGTPSEGWIFLMYEGADARKDGHTNRPAFITRFNLNWVTGGRD